MPNLTSPRVLMINNDSKHFVTHRLSQARLLEELGFDLHLAVPPPTEDLPFRSEADRAWFQRLRKHAFSLDRKGLNPIRELRAVQALTRIVRDVRPQIVHSVTPKGSIYGSCAARRAVGVRGIVSTITGLGFVFSSASVRARLLRPLTVRAYRSAFGDRRCRVIFQNPDDRGLFLSLGVLRAGQARLVPGSGVDVQHFRLTEEAPGPVKVLFAGRMLRDKGVETLVSAARLVREILPALEVHLLGDVDPSNPGSISRSELASWQSEGLVHWHGAVADVRPFLEAAHIACLPSYREGVPMALLEASAAGRAMVATDVPGCREVVETGKTGLLVPVGRPRELADALLSLARDPARRQAMGRAARARAETEFSRATIAGKVAGVYRECLETPV